MYLAPKSEGGVVLVNTQSISPVSHELMSAMLQDDGLWLRLSYIDNNDGSTNQTLFVRPVELPTAHDDDAGPVFRFECVDQTNQRFSVTMSAEPGGRASIEPLH